MKITFSLLLLFVLALLAFSCLHYLRFNAKTHQDNSVALSELTHFTRISLSTSYNENPLAQSYPQMSPLGRMDFVYAP